MKILKFLFPEKEFLPDKLITTSSSWKERQSEEEFWHHALQHSVGSTISSKVFVYQKGLFYHLCLNIS